MSSQRYVTTIIDDYIYLLLQLPKDEIADLDKELFQISTDLQATGVCPKNIESLVEQYAKMLQDSVEAIQLQKEPKDIVTDMLARCLIWSRIIKER
jgi:hypothetical protein